MVNEMFSLQDQQMKHQLYSQTMDYTKCMIITITFLKNRKKKPKEILYLQNQMKRLKSRGGNFRLDSQMPPS